MPKHQRRRTLAFARSHDRAAGAVALFAPCSRALAAIITRNFSERRGVVCGKIARARAVAYHAQRNQRARSVAAFRVGRPHFTREGLSFLAPGELDSSPE